MWIKLLKFSIEPPKVGMLSTKPSSVWREYLLRNKYGIDPLSNSMVGVEGADQAQTKNNEQYMPHSVEQLLWQQIYMGRFRFCQFGCCPAMISTVSPCDVLVWVKEHAPFYGLIFFEMDYDNPRYLG